MDDDTDRVIDAGAIGDGTRLVKDEYTISSGCMALGFAEAFDNFFYGSDSFVAKNRSGCLDSS